MSTPIESLPRRVIPRWRDFRTAASLGELSSFEPKAISRIIPFDLESLVRLWKQRRTDAVAGEVLSAAWLQRDTKLARDSAEFLLRPNSEARELTKDFARSILAEIEGEGVRAIDDVSTALDRTSVRGLRHALRLYSHDAIGWGELARFYAIIGKPEKARRAMLTALHLAPENRFILRSASRCLLHLGDPGAALDILLRAERTQVDPWLLAASVSIANILNKAPRFYKRAKDVSKVSSLPLLHRAELIAALGTLELFEGRNKDARRMLAFSLTEPTENVLAQAWWAKSRIGLRVEPALLDRPRSFEANTRALVQTANWEGAAKAAEQWLADEPFSSSPAIELSFILNVAFGEHALAENILKRAFRANPGNVLVQNNLAFALARQGKTAEADAVIARADISEAPPAHLVALTATKGLIRFREGKYIEGRQLYEEAIQLAKKSQRSRERALAAVYLAIEEKRAKTPEAITATTEAERLGTAFDDPLFRLAIKTLRDGHLERREPSGADNRQTKSWPTVTTFDQRWAPREKGKVP